MKKRADGRYSKMVDGKRFYANSEKELYRKIYEYAEKKEKGPTFKEVSRQWWSIEVEKLAPGTVRGYDKATERANEYFGDMPIKDITTAQVTKYLFSLARQGLAKKTVKNNKIVISRIFHFAMVECLITYNPATAAESPKNLAEKRRTAATPDEEQAIRQHSDAWLMPLFALLTGMRKGELIGLKWGDIDLEANLIHVRRSVWYGGGAHEKTPKTEAGVRSIPILSELYPHVKDARSHNPQHYVFGGEKPLSEKAYRYRLKCFQKETGTTATLHQLRKSFATMAVGADVPPDVLRTIIGHKDISTTMNIYAEVRGERISGAAASMDNYLSKKKK